MKARHVIHTVGPVWKGGQRGEPDTLASCYRASLALAAEKGLQTVAFPAISTGVYGYPRDLAAQVASRAIDDFLKGNATVSQVRLVFFAAADLDVFLQNCVWTRTPPR
jgi:O-acetyl-ADP-ribose deacetylase (regulator of RNase III)